MKIAGVFVACSVKYLIVIYLILSSVFSNAQGFLNDTLAVSPTGTYMHTGYEVDSGYFWVGMVPHPSAPGNPDQFLMGFESHQGNWQTLLLDYDTLQDQRAAFSINQLIRNNAGNFVHSYSNCGSGNCYPRLKEIAPDGTIVRDTIYRGVIDSLGLAIFDFNNVYYNELNDEYVLLVNAFDTAVYNAGLPASGRLLYLRSSNDFTILDTILLQDPAQTHSYLSASKCHKHNGKEVLMIQDQKQPAWDIDFQAKMVFYEIDALGNATRVADYGVGQNNRLSMSLISTLDSAFMFTYMQSYWEDNQWKYTNHLCKLDSNYQPLWDNPIGGNVFFDPYTELLQFRVLETADSNYIVAGGGSYNILLGAQLTKFNSEGDQLWRRRFAKAIPSVPDTSYSETTIRDVIENSKGGYTMFGQIYEDVFGQGAGVYGYIVEANCLGFVGSPEAAAAYTVEDNYQVSFVNNSMQAGSYTWYFGDGDSLQTDEYMDSVSHTYSGFGTYEVVLVAHGCDEEDTLVFAVNPALHSDPTVVTEGEGYFTLFPNPVQAGSELFVYLNGLNPDDGKVVLQFVSEAGEIANEITLSALEGTYMITSNLAGGMYHINLWQGGQKLQTRKLVVY